MATTVSTFITDDGKKFKTLDEANAHEAKLQHKAEMDAYTATLKFKTDNPKGVALSRARVSKVVGDYLTWKAAQAAALAEALPA